MSVVCAGKDLVVLSLVKLMVHVAPGVDVHTEVIVLGAGEPLRFGWWLLTKFPEGATKAAPELAGIFAASSLWLVEVLGVVDDLDGSPLGSFTEAPPVVGDGAVSWLEV